MHRFETFREPDAEKLREIQAAVVKAVMPYRDRDVPAILLVLALANATRVVLRLMEPPEQKALLDAVVPFLEGRTEPRGGELVSGIILPPGSSLN